MCQLLDQLKDELDNINKERKNQSSNGKLGIKKSQDPIKKEFSQSSKTNEENLSNSISSFNFDTLSNDELEKLSNNTVKLLNYWKSKQIIWNFN